MKSIKKSLSLLLAIVMVLGSIIPGIDLATKVLAQEEKRIVIHNPYKDVEWEKYDQYKANFHSHTTESDGKNKPVEMIEEHYRQGYDVVAMTDHNFLFKGIDRTDTGKDYVTPERRAELEAGIGRDGRKITFIPHSDEQSRHDHVNTFWTDYNNPIVGASMEESIKQAEQLGGISHINHPGRYTGGRNTANNGADGEAASNDPKNIQKYLNLFNKYNSLLGMEIINKKDGDSYSDRILWDNLLKETMPNRPIWGFSNDDNHSIAATGFSYNILLMPENNEIEIRKSMEAGSFYAIARVSKRELGNSFVGTGKAPRISKITVNGSEISITNENVDRVQWIADGKLISEGNSIDLSKYTSEVNGYVRANLIGPGGIAFTQPFGVEVEQNDIDITFDPNGGRLKMGLDFNASVTISKDTQPQVLPEDVFTDGYTRATKEVNGKEVEFLGWKIEGTETVLTEEDLKTYEFKESTTLIAQWKEEATKYPPVAEKINKVVGEKVTEEEVLAAVTVPNYPEGQKEPTKALKYDASNLPDGNKEEGFTAYVLVTYPDGSKAEALVEINITKGEEPTKPPVKPEEIRVTFEIKDKDKDVAEFVKDEHGGIYITFVYPKGKDASEVEAQAPKVKVKDGYEFKGWTPAFEGKLNEDTVYTAVINKKAEKPDPVEPTTPTEPTEPSDSSKIETDRTKGKDNKRKENPPTSRNKLPNSPRKLKNRRN